MTPGDIYQQNLSPSHATSPTRSTPSESRSSRSPQARNKRSFGHEPKRQDSEFEQRVIEVRRVVRVTAGGRRFSFRVLVAVGNRKGKVGFGMGKAKDISEAIGKGNNMALKHIIEVPLTRKTIPFEMMAKFKMAKILLKPAPLGRGIIAGGTVRDLCELAGIENITAKVLSGSKSKINNAKAVLRALAEMKRIFEVKSEKKITGSSETKGAGATTPLVDA